ncbi:MAG: DUF1285 domain-containing protein [Pseudomonadales bacterium]|nr:DUF1285 domain-containing protein [Pseudomonadales bacterium]
MRIARDGTWFHEGRPIRREALVQLFASVLKKEQGRYYLVTPVEKVGIQVDDCPFVACGAEWTGSGPELSLILTLNTGDRVTVDKAHPLTVSTLPDSEEPHPVVLVRNGLEALLSRNVFYQLVDAAESRSRDGRTCLGIYSKGEFFELGSYQG